MIELPDPILQDRFDCLRQLEKGAAIQSWLVADRRSGRRGILEAVLDGASSSADQLAPARSLIGGGSEHVVEIVAVDVDSRGLPYLLREDVGGVSLKEALAADAVSVPLGIEVIRQCLDALDFLHRQGIWAQNLSPKDVSLSIRSGALRVVVTETGVFSPWQEAPGATAAASVLVGRLKYASPEQFDDSSPMGPASGIYALGLVAYEALTGTFPIQGKSASSLIAGHLFRPPIPFEQSDPESRLSLEIRSALTSMLAKGPSDRFQSILEAKASWSQLDRSASGESVDWGEQLEGLEALLVRATTAQDAVSAPAPMGTETVRLTAEKIAEIQQLAAASGAPGDGPTAMIRQVRDQVHEEDARRREAEAEQREQTLLRIESLLDQARSAAQGERFQDAVEAVGEALVLSPDHADALMLQASLDACLRIQEEEQLERQVMAQSGQGPGLPPVPVPVPTVRTTPPVQAAASVQAGLDRAAEARTVQFSREELSSVLADPGPSETPPASIPGAPPPVPGARPRRPGAPPPVSAAPAPSASSTAASPSTAGSMSSIEGFGSVTLPMATIEEAKRRAKELEAAKDKTADRPAAIRASATHIEPGGSVTLPLAVVQEAKEKYRNEQRGDKGPEATSGVRMAAEKVPSSAESGPMGGGNIVPGKIVPGNMDPGNMDSENPVTEPPYRAPESLKAQAYEPAGSGAQSSSRNQPGPPPALPVPPTPAVPAAAGPSAEPTPNPGLAAAQARTPAERTLSDLGFGNAGGGDFEPEPTAEWSPPAREHRSSRRTSRRSGPPDRRGNKSLMIAGLISALVLVFVLSFILSGRLAEFGQKEDQIISLPAEDVEGAQLPPGWLALDASPWAEIASVVDASGEKAMVVGAAFTPKRLELRPGQYTLTLTHPGLSEPIDVTVEIETGQVTRQRIDMGMDTNEMLTRSGW